MSFPRRARAVRAPIVVSLALLAALLAPAARSRAACAGFGTGALFAAGASPQAVACGDFDRDGVTDLAVANASGASLSVLRGLGGGAFAAPVPYAAGTAGRALVVGDVNGDGIADVVVAVSTGVATWLGNGDGTFRGGALTPAGSANDGIACGDFDGDGILDLALASNGANAVLVLRGGGASGIGDGTFGAPAAYAVGTAPARLVAADLDGDGILDLAVADNGGAAVSILRGHGANGIGDGTFAAATTVAVAGYPWGVAAIDWNGDGVADLVVSNGAGTSLALLRGTGRGAFAAAGTVTTPTAPRDLVAGDFDGDGRADLAVACAAGNAVSVLHGTGAGFTPLASFAAAAGASGLAAADLDGDGAPDLVCTNAAAACISRLLATCPSAPGSQVTLLAPVGGETWWPGTPQPVRWSRGGGVVAVDVDLSHDGGATWLPLARGVTTDHAVAPAAGAPGAHLRVRVHDALVPARADASPGDFTLCGLLGEPIASEAGIAPTLLAGGDADGDGTLDLAASDGVSTVVLRGDGHGAFAPLASLAAGDSTLRLWLVDADGDGRADLVRMGAAGVAVRRGDGAGGFGAETVHALTGGRDLLVRDLDGDGVPDVVVLAADGTGARLLAWSGAAPSRTWTTALAGAPVAIAAADFDGDGITDLAVATAGALQLWYGNGAGARGDGTFRAGPTRALPTRPGAIAAGDLDGDGTPDVLACVPATGDVWRLIVTPPSAAAPAGAIAAPVAAPAGPLPAAPILADFDGDGHADVALALGGGQALGVLPTAGAAPAGAVRFVPGAGAAAIVVGDFTGDRAPDVVVAGADGRVRCLPAQCPPRIAASIALADVADTTAVTTGFARTIAWSRSASIGAVHVELSRDGGAHWTTLADDVAGGAFTWVASAPATARARLRVSDATCATRFDESQPFAIRAPFGAPRASVVPAGAGTFACADVDGDGAFDVVLADSAALELMRGDGAGGFAAGVRLEEPATSRVRVADLDADGLPDLLALHEGAVSVRRGTGAGAFAPPQAVAVEWTATDVAVADVDRDGRPDLVVTSDNGVAHRVSVRRGLGRDATGALAFGPPAIVSLPAAPTALAIADVTGDGVPDLVVAHAAGLSLLRGAGDGSFRIAATLGFGAGGVRALWVGDLDRDGATDVAAVDALARTLVIARGDGAGGLRAAASLALAGTPVALAAADVDRDGAADLAVLLADGQLVLERGLPGAPGIGVTECGRVATGAAGAALAWCDADGDGVPDAIVLDPHGTLDVAAGIAGAAGAPALVTPLPAVLKVGDAVALAWTRPPGVVSVDVELSRDGGTRWTPVARGLTGTAWTWLASGPATYAGALRVRDAARPARAGGAFAPFSLEPSVLAAGDAPVTHAELRLACANPAHGACAFALALPHAAHVRVEIADVAGRRVRTLADATRPAGTSTLHWDGADGAGTPLPAGLYFVRARAVTAGLDAVARVVLAR